MKKRYFIMAFFIGMTTFSSTSYAGSKEQDREMFYQEAMELVNEFWSDDYASEISFTVGQSSVVVDGEKVQARASSVASTQNDGGCFMVSAEAFSQAVGGACQVQQSNGTIQVQDGGQSIQMKVNSNVVESDTKTFTSLGKVKKEKNDILLPADAIAEGLGYEIVQQDKDSISFAKAFQTKRLIVSSNNRNINVNTYGAAKTVTNTDGTCVMQFESIEDTKEAYDKLAAQSGVEVEEDKCISICAPQNNLSSAPSNAAGTSHLSWGPEYIHSDTMLSKMSASQKSRSVIVAVVDTGVYSHDYFSGRVLSGKSMIGGNANSDAHGHGTHVAGIIADVTNGTNVKILPVQVLNASGQGTNLTVALGVQWAVDHHADIINLSLGGYDASTSHYLDTIINKAVASNVTVVAAAGNDNYSSDSFCPAHISSLICVGAVNSAGSRADFSNYGSNMSVAAPGVAVNSTIPSGYASWNGTSMAAPFVSASAALIKEAMPNAAPAAIKSMLMKCCDDKGTVGWDIYYGSGIINLSKISMNSEDKPTPSPTPTPEPSPTPNPIPAPSPAPHQQPAPVQDPDEDDGWDDDYWDDWTPPQIPDNTPSVPMYAVSVSVSSQNCNGVSKAQLTIRTGANIKDVTITVDGYDYRSHVSGSNGVYQVDVSGLGHGTHTYYVAYGGSVSQGSFTK